MKYYKRLNVYKASNVEFDPNICAAWSYGWWKFVAVINGKVVFNDYNYSNTTLRHQYKVRRLLHDLGIEIDLVVEAPGGLQNLDSALKYEALRIQELEEQIAKPRSHRRKNEERRQEILECITRMQAIHNLKKAA